MDIRKRAYELYQLDWMMSKGYSLQDVVNVLREGYYDGLEEEEIDGGTSRDEDFDYVEDYFNEHGFNGNIFACEDEFFSAEYMDVEYMHSLLVDDELIKAYHFDGLKEAMEIAGWQLVEADGERTEWMFAPDGERTEWMFAPDGEQGDLPFPDAESQNLESSFSLIKFSYDELREYLEDVIITNPNQEERFNQLLTTQYVKEQTDENSLAAVKLNGLSLEFVKEQTPEICLAAIMENPDALYYVKEQTAELCMAAVVRDGWCLQYVNKQTPEICLAAVMQNPSALCYVKEKTPEIVRAAQVNNNDIVAKRRGR